MLFGTGCKQATIFTKMDKRYIAQITLGANSITGDGEGEKIPVSEIVPSLTLIEAAVVKLTGKIMQIPSKYSAIKIDGKEAYKRARAGETVVMPSREVNIYESAIIRYEYPILELNSRVSSGTYIRSLAEDLGRILETGAYLSGLVRTEVEHYSLSEAGVLDEVDMAFAEQHILGI